MIYNKENEITNVNIEGHNITRVYRGPILVWDKHPDYIHGPKIVRSDTTTTYTIKNVPDGYVYYQWDVYGSGQKSYTVSGNSVTVTAVNNSSGYHGGNIKFYIRCYIKHQNIDKPDILCFATVTVARVSFNDLEITPSTNSIYSWLDVRDADIYGNFIIKDAAISPSEYLKIRMYEPRYIEFEKPIIFKKCDPVHVGYAAHVIPSEGDDDGNPKTVSGNIWLINPIQYFKIKNNTNGREFNVGNSVALTGCINVGIDYKDMYTSDTRYDLSIPAVYRGTQGFGISEMREGSTGLPYGTSSGYTSQSKIHLRDIHRYGDNYMFWIPFTSAQPQSYIPPQAKMFNKYSKPYIEIHLSDDRGNDVMTKVDIPTEYYNDIDKSYAVYIIKIQYDCTATFDLQRSSITQTVY